MEYWKQVALDRLAEYARLSAASDTMEAELALCPNEGDLNAGVFRAELTDRVQRAAAVKKQVGAALDRLDPEDRTVLEMLCIRPRRGNVDRLCSLLDREKTTIYRRRDAALRHFTTALLAIS